MSDPAPIPAATLVVFRERDGAPELLMVERAGAMAFAGGALVFPGGRVDPVDHVLAAGADDADDAAARVAAIRETIEESGIAIGIAPPPDHEAIATLRAGLASGEDFALLLERGGWSLDLAALTPFARWCPNFRESRNFDTRFYLAELPEDAPEATVDATENVRLLWASAAEILAMAARGEARIIFPTRRNLERLAGLASFAAARADAARYPSRLIQPWIEERDGVATLCIPPDLGYPVTSEPMAAVRRG